MSRSALAVVVGLLLAGAVLSLARAWRPPPPSLASLRDRLGRTAPAAGIRPDDRSDHMLHRVAARLSAGDGGARLAARYAAELRATGSTVPDLVARCLAAAVAGAVTVVAAGTAARVDPGVLAALALLAAAGGVAVPVVLLRAAAERSRRAFRNAAADVVGLVAVCLTSGRSVEEAVRYATEVGEGPAFTELRAAVVQAPLVGRTVWEALDSVAVTWDVPELSTFASSVERAAVVGASIADTVATQAHAMRQRALDELEREADGANLRMLAPTYLFVAGFIAFLLYPLITRISGAGL